MPDREPPASDGQSDATLAYLLERSAEIEKTWDQLASWIRELATQGDQTGAEAADVMDETKVKPRKP